MLRKTYLHWTNDATPGVHLWQNLLCYAILDMTDESAPLRPPLCCIVQYKNNRTRKGKLLSWVPQAHLVNSSCWTTVLKSPLIFVFRVGAEPTELTQSNTHDSTKALKGITTSFCVKILQSYLIIIWDTYLGTVWKIPVKWVPNVFSFSLRVCVIYQSYLLCPRPSSASLCRSDVSSALLTRLLAAAYVSA